MQAPYIFTSRVKVLTDETFYFCSFYYRRAISLADPDQMRELALTLLDELEDHRQVFRDLGFSPPLKDDPAGRSAAILRRDAVDPVEKLL